MVCVNIDNEKNREFSHIIETIYIYAKFKEYSFSATGRCNL